MEKNNLSDCTAVKKETEETSPNDNKNVYESSHAILSPKHEVDLDMISSGVSVEVEPDFDPINWESTSSQDEDTTAELLLENDSFSEGSRTPSVSGITSIYLKQEEEEEDLDFKQEVPSDIQELAKNDTNEKDKQELNSSVPLKVLPREDLYKYQCRDCYKTFLNKRYLYEHRRIHAGKQPFECDVCKKTFAFNSNLSEHRRTHTGEKPFECDICKKKFSQKSNVTKHRRSHTGKKPFQCTVCGKCFTFSSNLCLHRRIHTGEKPFQCDICEKRFITNSNLSEHRRTHTGKKSFECDICNETFWISATLKSHRKTHNGENANN
ncbi:zinc finger and SCAN domain-containing protein 31-like isoform X1 [Artemia franciscana]|uniref:zinc finger and SCAN domain-containing protein 31-like isoform X1 n=2 Tax=Artemia franciscana TaxID=6661 RepID=UPI0032DB70AC